MSIVMGVDPGAFGAMAIYDSALNTLISVEDMPIWYMLVGKSKRARVDAVELAERVDTAKMLGVDLVVIEAVGGRPKQSASSGFAFGYTCGLLYMACINSRLAIETIPPATWKKMLRVPGKKSGYLKKGELDAAIVSRATEIFPEARENFKGPQGGLKVDRAEAAMLAKFGADHILRATGPVIAADTEWRLAYRNADTGA